jgi:hypothetical protein
VRVGPDGVQNGADYNVYTMRFPKHPQILEIPFQQRNIFVNGVSGLGFMSNQKLFFFIIKKNGPSLGGIENLYNGLSETTKFLDI